ncbi:MAG: GHKL domain-containing protein [Blautia sp.]|nr:GHKL domain-containing protein [Blautia sp.]
MDSGLPTDIFLTVTSYRSVYLLLCAVLLYMVVRSVRSRVKGCNAGKYLKWGWFLVPLFLVCEIYFQRVYKLLISERVIQRWWLFLMGSLLAALAFGAYAVIQKERENGRLLKMKMDMLEGDYAELMRVYEEKEILRHDIKMHMRVIREMAEEGHDQEILCYLDEMDSVFQKGRNRNLANHDLINLIVNQKFREAEGVGISLRYELEDMSGLLLKPIEICALFSNMLDNAIEANGRIAEGMERWIELTCARKGQMLILHTSNPMTGTGMRFSEGLPETTKGDKRNHGFGMRSIRQVVNTYEGHMRIENKDGVFDLTVYLKGF